MFTLLNPFALLALAGILVPVAIHLWNRRPGREVAVGSLRWLAAGANRRLRNLKLEQLWLLLLRAALLMVLAVAVAEPVWRQPQPTSRGVVLLSAEAAGLPALAALKPTLDSLRGKGYTLRWLAAGFRRVPDSAWQTLKAGQSGTTADSLNTSATTNLDNQLFAWARVQQAVATFPGQPLLVVTSTGLRNFGGSHAPLPAAVSWQMLPDTTSTTWLANAARVGDSLSLLVGRSSETRTTYRREKLLVPRNEQPVRVPGLPPLRLRPNRNGGAGFTIVNDSAPASDPDIGFEVAPLDIEIYASPEYAADARYLEAALRAAGTGLAIPPRLHRLQTRPTQLKTNWTFWLSAEPLPQDWQQDTRKYGRQLWREATRAGVADTAHFATAETGAAPVTVFRRDSRPASKGSKTVWVDGRGRAILVRQALGRGRVYQLLTRLNPTWSTLADDPQLPGRLLKLLHPEPTDDFGLDQPTQLAKAEAAHDRRALPPAQLPTTAKSANRPTLAMTQPPAFRTTDLRPWLVLLAGLLLLLERLWAARRTAETSSPSV